MPLPKVKAADAIKSDDGNDSIDTFIRQAIGKEPLLSFPRANESPVQWIQLLQALDQQDLPGWPLLSPMKIQMQKCDKCSREFCSTINYRRHMRLHRRKLNIEKDSTSKNRGLLQDFWEKLSAEEAMDILSFEDVALEGVTGSSITKALTSFIRKPGYTSLPPSYLKAGSVLLDIVQGRRSRFPVSSEELFSILDDASESTFLCAGTAESLQKFVFDGDAGKIGLEMRNLVACTCFLVEQKLVKAFLADKDAEALRYHKLLVEEEEAAQRRQAALLEKKRQKKLRQKELRAKELAIGEIDDSPEETPPSPPTSTSSPADAVDSTLEIPEIFLNATPSPAPAQPMNSAGDTSEDHDNGYPDIGDSQNGHLDLGAYQNVEHRTLHRGGRRHVSNTRWQASKLPRNPNGFNASHNYQVQKPGVIQKRSSRDPNTAAHIKVWTPKPKSETNLESAKTRVQNDAPKLPTQQKHEVLIGSISVSLGNRIITEHDGNVGGASELSVPSENSSSERPIKSDADEGVAVKLWRPVSKHENGGQIPIPYSNSASENRSMPCNEQRLAESSSNDCEAPDSFVEGKHLGGVKFSSHVAKAFLSQRWKEAITSDHVKLVLSPEDPPGRCELQGDHYEESSKLDPSTILRSAENRLPTTIIDSSAAKKPKVRAKPEKGGKVKYIPKQRSVC